MPIPTNEIIEAAIGGLEARKQHIDTQVAELRQMLSGTPIREAASAGLALKQFSACGRRSGGDGRR